MKKKGAMSAVFASFMPGKIQKYVFNVTKFIVAIVASSFHSVPFVKFNLKIAQNVAIKMNHGNIK